MNFTQIMIAYAAGWLSAILALIRGFRLLVPYLDRRLLPPVKKLPATQKLPEATI